MALTSALNLATFGMVATEIKVSLASQNITNADVAGYTRKTYNPGLLTTNVGTYVIGGDINGSVNKYLIKDIVDDTSLTAAKKALSEMLNIYGKQIGNVAAEYSLADSMDDIFNGLSALAVSPEDTAYRTQVVNDAGVLTSYLNQISDTIQAQRLAADGEIANSVDRINASLQKIADLNEAIVSGGGVQGMDTANYEDQRMHELQVLAEEVDIRYFMSSDNRVQIYTPGGQPLLLSNAKTLTFNAATSMDSTNTYPGTLSGITINGIDITSSIGGGKIDGYLNTRDQFFVEEQAKMDELTDKLMLQVNGALNKGTSVPPRTQIIGSERGLTGGESLAGSTGIFRVAVMNNSGTIVNYQDFDISTFATSSDMVAALNSVPGISATFTADGQLQIDATAAGTGIAINENNTVTTPDGLGISHYFGLNNLFQGNNASNVSVATYLQSRPDNLATGALSMSATLAAGDLGVTAGDGTVAKLVADSLYATTSFDAAGNFVAQSNSIMDYTQALMTNAVFRTDAANDAYDTASIMLASSQQTLDGTQGVNIDEETAYLLQLETQYKASASVIQTIQALFDALIESIR